jgi:integrase
MARSRKPSVWIEPHQTRGGIKTYRVRAEKDGERLPDIPCGTSLLHAREVRDRVKADLWAGRLQIHQPSKVSVAQWRDEYLTVCREQNPKSYARFDLPAVESLTAFLGAELPLRAVDAGVDLVGAQDRIRAWKAELEARGGRRRGQQIPLGPTTVRMRMAHARAGLSWARKRGWITLNPFELVEFPKAKKNDRVLSGDELRVIYEEILPPQHHDWFTLLRWTGLRKEELIGLSKRQAVRPQKPDELWRLVFSGEQTKNAKPKAVEVHPEAQAALERALASSKTDQLFEGLTDDKVEHWFARISARLGRVTPHMLKHTFCTRFMEATGDMDSLALMTGNSRRSLELHYIHLSRARPRGVLSVDFGYSAPPTLPLNAGGAGGG